MRVLIINTSEKKGGAAIAANRLMDALRNHGIQAKMLVCNKQTDNPNVIRLVQVVGEKELSVKEIMDRLGLKDRKNILNLYLTPSMKEGYIRQLYPQSPRHPRQKYLLTVKGLALYNELNLLPNNLKK